MMHKDIWRRDARCANLSRPQNVLLDGLATGKVNRREFLAHGAVIGMSLATLTAMAAAAGLGAAPVAPAAAGLPTVGPAGGPTGGRVRVGQIMPLTAMEPSVISDRGGIVQLAAVGEYLCLCGADFVLRPMLAESWAPNSDGTVWRFKIRKDVTFHDGHAMTAADVTATFERLIDPESGSNALTILEGYLGKGGTVRLDDETVEFRLMAAHGNFPYLVSSENYNAIIQPADYTGGFDSAFNGTGPFRLEKYVPRTGSAFVRNESYWGDKALPERIEYQFYANAAQQIEDLRAGRLDVICDLPFGLAAQAPSVPGSSLLAVPTASHHQIHMRCNEGVFADARMRRAVALCLDRPALVAKLTNGHAQLGNDSPLAPFYPFTAQNLPQRSRDIAQARQLVEAAGFKDGFTAKLTIETFMEIPELALEVQAAVKDIGGRIEIQSFDQGGYFGAGVFGKSPWLDSPMGITDYGHRGLPNVCLTASLGGSGAWNAARYRGDGFDRLARSFIAALDLDTQRQAAAELQQRLLDDTPVIFPYFHDALTLLAKGVTGVSATASGQVLLAGAAVAK